jgi:hypothetical protein
MNSAVLEKGPESVPVDPNEILTVHQAARVLKVSYSHMLRLIRGEVNGMPPVHHVRAGRSVRIRRGAHRLDQECGKPEREQRRSACMAISGDRHSLTPPAKENRTRC